MKSGLDHAALKAKQRAIRKGFPETMGLRAHRSISWIGRAETCDEDDDARFIFLWIAFNAAYADEQEFQAAAPGERAAFVDYFGRLKTATVFHDRRTCCHAVRFKTRRRAAGQTVRRDHENGEPPLRPSPLRVIGSLHVVGNAR